MDPTWAVAIGGAWHAAPRANYWQFANRDAESGGPYLYATGWLTGVTAPLILYIGQGVQMTVETYPRIGTVTAIEARQPGADAAEYKVTLRLENRPAAPADLDLRPDALTGMLAAVVQAQAGRCLICDDAPALYCGNYCAQRGR